MLVLLATIRDFLIVTALAWIGVTLEQRAEHETRAPACGENAQACE